MTLTIENESGMDFDFHYEELATEVVNAAIETEDFPFEAEVNILMVTKEEISESANLQFKFVYSGPDSVTEIENILEQIAVKTNTRVEWLSEYVMLMPEGTTNDQLSAISQECAQVCIDKGWTFCDRLHIRIWGDKRGV